MRADKDLAVIRGDVSIDDTLAALDRLVDVGKIREIGAPTEVVKADPTERPK